MLCHKTFSFSKYQKIIKEILGLILSVEKESMNWYQRWRGEGEREKWMKWRRRHDPVVRRRRRRQRGGTERREEIEGKERTDEELKGWGGSGGKERGGVRLYIYLHCAPPISQWSMAMCVWTQHTHTHALKVRWYLFYPRQIYELRPS